MTGRRAALLCAVLSAIALGASAGFASPSSPEQRLLHLLNQERATAGLAQLTWDDHLAQAARPHSELLAKHGALSHMFAGEQPLLQRAGAAGARFNSVAENVAYAPEVDLVHKSLMESPPHRANILNRDYNAVGIGIVERDGELYVTEDFARLLPAYTATEFGDQVIAAVNQLRAQKGIALVGARSDTRLQKAACTTSLDAQKILKLMPGATDVAVFTASQPGTLPSSMQRAASDRTLHRMAIGVCFQSGDKAGFSKYWVVAAFYPVQ